MEKIVEFPKGFSGGHVLDPRPGMGELLDAAAVARSDAALGPTVRDNRNSVEARRGALLALVEQVKEWTSKGEYSTEAELQALFAKVYRSLPVVEKPAAPKAAHRPAQAPLPPAA